MCMPCMAAPYGTHMVISGHHQDQSFLVHRRLQAAPKESIMCCVCIAAGCARAVTGAGMFAMRWCCFVLLLFGF